MLELMRVKGENNMKEKEFMTPEQFAELMGVTTQYLSKYNARVIAKAEKEKGLIIRKEGRGKNAKYLLESLDESQSIFENNDYSFDFDKEFISYKDLKFKILLTLTLKPDRTFFEGELEELAKEIGIELEQVKDENSKKTNDRWIKKIHEAILELQEEEVIVAYFDKKQKKKKVWVLFIRPSAKENLIPINTDGIIYAKKLCDAKEINIKWENFLKVWLALKVFKLDNVEKFKTATIEQMTGISKTTILKVINFMKQEGMLEVDRNVVYIRETKSFCNNGLKTGKHNFDFNIL